MKGRVLIVDDEPRMAASVRTALERSGYECECAGKAALYHGPLLLAYDTGPDPQVVYSPEWKTFGGTRASNDLRARIDCSFEGRGIEWHGAYFDDAGRARVWIDDREVAVVDQYDQQRGRPFVWKSPTLSPGTHRLRLEVTGQKSSASQGVWVNAERFYCADSRPEFDVQKMSIRALATNGRARRLAVEMNDVDGRPVRLSDYGTAGYEFDSTNSRSYTTWLTVSNVQGAPFSRTNPSRTVRIAR